MLPNVRRVHPTWPSVRSQACQLLQLLDEKVRVGAETSAAPFLQLGFDDVLAEPDTAQGFDAVWKLAYVVFTQTKLWLYRYRSIGLAEGCVIYLTP